MNALPYKSKQYGLIVLKLLLLGLTLYYIQDRLTDQTANTTNGILMGFRAIDLPFLMIIILMASLNWWLESLKWKFLVSGIRPIGMVEAVKQTLSGLTLSMATPARIGDFGVKAAYFPKLERRSILVKNTIAHGAQLMTTFIFGAIGLYMISHILKPYLDLASLWVLAVLLALVTLGGYLFWRSRISGKLQQWKMSRSGLRILGLSMGRYLCFSLMFALLIDLQGVELSWTLSLPLIWVTYLLSSAIPSFLFLDVAIKGGVAVWLFSLIGISAWPVICAASLMWLFNMIIPALFGAWFSLHYRPSYL